VVSAPIRIAVWSTGGVGSIAIDAIRRRCDFELVGVWVHSQDRVGRDAGELAGGDPIGLAATNDAAALIALRPDCVVYTASGPKRDAGAVPDYLRLLACHLGCFGFRSTTPRSIVSRT
jgi:2,4-diaminopentanoate dehydrogenase